MPDYNLSHCRRRHDRRRRGPGAPQADPAGLRGSDQREPHPPTTSPLSKALWEGRARREDLAPKTAATGATLHLRRAITAIDPRGPVAEDDRGTKYRFTKLLNRHRRRSAALPLRRPDHYYRTLDVTAACEAPQRRASVPVIGGGLSAARSRRGCDAAARRHDARAEAGLGARVFPGGPGPLFWSIYRQKGVTMADGRGDGGSSGAPAPRPCAPPVAARCGRVRSPGSASAGRGAGGAAGLP